MLMRAAKFSDSERVAGLTHHFQVFECGALWRSVLSQSDKCQKIKNGGLDQYCAERSEV